MKGVAGRSGAGLVHQVDQGAVVRREADAFGPDLGVLHDAVLRARLDLNP